jgi:WD40 repeat protein
MRSTAESTTPARPRQTFGDPSQRTDGDILALCFSGDTLLSVEEPGVLRRWDAATRERQSCDGLDELATFWTFHPDGSLLAACADEVGVWDTRTGEQLIGWSTPSWSNAVAFQPAGTLVATGHDEGTVYVWDRETGRQKYQLTAHELPVGALAFSPDGKTLATAGEDRLIHLWNATDGAKIGTLAGHNDRIPALQWHPNGSRLYSAGWDTSVWVWDAKTLEPVILLNSHAAQLQALAVSVDGRVLAVADSDQAVHLWDTTTNKSWKVIRGSGEIRTLALSADGKRVAWGGSDRVVHIWDTQHESQVEGAGPVAAARPKVAVSHDGSRLYSLSADGDFRAWDVVTARRTATPDGASVLLSFALSPDGKWLVGGRREADSPDVRSTLARWSTAGGSRTVLEGQTGPITALAFSADSASLASANGGPDVWLWNVSSGQPALILPDAARGFPVESVCFHPTRPLVATAGVDYVKSGGKSGWIAIWDVAKREELVALAGPSTAMIFSPRGDFLAVAAAFTVKFFEASTGKLAHETAGHTEPITSLAFTPDGKFLATGGDDRCVRLWDVTSGEALGAIDLGSQVKALTFSADGEWLFTGHANTGCSQVAVAELKG